MIGGFVAGPAGLGVNQVTPEPPLPFVSRPIHEHEYQPARVHGFLQIDQCMNPCRAEGAVTVVPDHTFCLPAKVASDADGDYPVRHVKIALDPEQPWHYDRDGYAKTNEQIPM